MAVTRRAHLPVKCPLQCKRGRVIVSALALMMVRPPPLAAAFAGARENVSVATPGWRFRRLSDPNPEPAKITAAQVPAAV
jgi:hypothetical protein